MEQTAQPIRPVMREPEVLPEYYDEDGEGQNLGVGWDLSWGCKLTLGPDDDGQWSVTISMSDEDQRRGILVRAVTREQVRAYVEHLLGLVAPEDELRAGLGDSVAEITALRTQVERLSDHVARAADTWTSLTPEQRAAIRRQSNELYDALGAMATAYYYPSREEQK